MIEEIKSQLPFPYEIFSSPHSEITKNDKIGSSLLNSLLNCALSGMNLVSSLSNVIKPIMSNANIVKDVVRTIDPFITIGAGIAGPFLIVKGLRDLKNPRIFDKTTARNLTRAGKASLGYTMLRLFFHAMEMLKKKPEIISESESTSALESYVNWIPLGLATTPVWLTPLVIFVKCKRV